MSGRWWKKEIEQNRVFEIDYNTKKTLDLQDSDIEECSRLYSSSYGKYSTQSDRNPGQQVKMSPRYYKEHYCKEGIYIATAKDSNRLVGHAIYIRNRYENYGVMTWVLQLVVHRDYRKKGIASTLLRSIWGFSDDFAWGLASANPCTVHTLESATFRKCKPDIIKRNLRAIRLIGNDTTFVDMNAYIVNSASSQVNTHFYVDNSEYAHDPECERSLGKLRPGHEWLAFTFRTQGIQKDKYEKHFNEIVAFSEKKLKDAYGRMDMATHGWTKGTSNEIEFLTRNCEKGTLLDLGCGIGRHALGLAERGYLVKGIDFSQKHIDYACKKRDEMGISFRNCEFICTDVRSYNDEKLYDNVICLFDVIGSFPDEEENKKIIKTAMRHLKVGGTFIVSVMNMELTETIVPEERKVSMRSHPEVLMNLPPSNTMQSSGKIFNPDLLAIDMDTRVVFRKEQFENDDNLSAEYVIRDKRYTMLEIKTLIELQGFEVLSAQYVRAGHFGEPLDALDMHAKEICVVAKKR